MIKNINLEGFPCFAVDAGLNNLEAINHIYGPNGSGKTTISEFLTTLSPEGNQAVHWEGDPDTIRVYNRSYARSVFAKPEGEEPGVFLLGEDSAETLKKIDALTAKQNKINEKLANYKADHTNTAEELETEKKALQETIWERLDAIPDVLRQKMPKTKGNKRKCLEEALRVASEPYNPQDGTFDSLEKMANDLNQMGETESAISAFPSPPSAFRNAQGFYSLLSKPIVGSADVPLSALVNSLSNSDWVREGIAYLNDQHNINNVCPFCQQEVSEELKSKIESVFDATYRNAIAAIQSFKQILDSAHQEITAYEREHVGKLARFAPVDHVTLVFENIKSAIRQLQSSLTQKLASPSTPIAPAMITDKYDALDRLVTEANLDISSLNDRWQNSEKEWERIQTQSWKFFVNERLKDLIDSFNHSEGRLNKKLAGLSEKINRLDSDLTEISNNLKDLHSRSTSSQRTIELINSLLEDARFRSFKLCSASGNSDGYKLVRPNGNLVDIESLSEGERTFITFLYFYHSLFSVKQDDETDHIVAVIDDPISSLDSEIMFVVSWLIRRLIEQVKEGTHDRVKQLIILTHNRRFHNELCVQYRNQNPKNVAFYRIRKLSPSPNLIQGPEKRNPIRNSYQELWDEVAIAKSSPHCGKPWLPNVLRRILETYFVDLVGLQNLNYLGEDLPLEEQVMHKALIAWTNTGSHSIIEADDYLPESENTDLWLELFKNVFYKEGNGAHKYHYNMMMAGTENNGKS